VLKRAVSVCGLVLALMAASGVRVALAQPTPPAATDGFVPVTDLPPAEQLPAAPLVLGAYAFIWVAVLAYVALLWRRQGAIQKDLDALKQLPPR
jgi:CcmD family protein